MKLIWIISAVLFSSSLSVAQTPEVGDPMESPIADDYLSQYGVGPNQPLNVTDVPSTGLNILGETPTNIDTLNLMNQNLAPAAACEDLNAEAAFALAQYKNEVNAAWNRYQSAMADINERKQAARCTVAPPPPNYCVPRVLLYPSK